MDNNYEPTDMNLHVVDTDTDYDVRIFDDDYGDNNAIAWVVCPPEATTGGGAHPNKWCFGQRLRYNLHYPGFYNTVQERHSLACEELGHTMGLRHRSDHPETCMGRPVENSTDLTAHDRNHIDDEYTPSSGPA